MVTYEYDPGNLISALIRQKANQDNELIERAVEQALQGGEHGVLSLRSTDGALIAAVHPHVPYGEIWWAPAFSTTEAGLIAEFTAWRPRS